MRRKGIVGRVLRSLVGNDNIHDSGKEDISDVGKIANRVNDNTSGSENNKLSASNGEKNSGTGGVTPDNSYIEEQIRSELNRINPSKIAGTEHIVCFLDVLNYESMIVTGTDKVNCPEDMLAYVRKMLARNPIHQFAVASLVLDCLVVSYDISGQREDAADIYMVLNSVKYLLLELALNGYFVQGGMSVGEFYHTERRCMGKALQRAIACSRNAIYPRIVIDSELFHDEQFKNHMENLVDAGKHNMQMMDDWYHCIDAGHLPEEIRNDYKSIRKNPQAIHYFDYLETTLDAQTHLIPVLKEKIEYGIQNTEADERERFLWFAKYFNSVVYNRLCLDRGNCVNLDEYGVQE